ncbi:MULTISPECIES: M56 family metallopeptidase [Anaerotruncus]|uniref:M56 family metallopeptidase n=1 Tax=Anaerotruncus TaxID=244127 RepID=UPI0020819C2F|nr:M56 family metallopeptidase [Anaerotruncus massiliensis (ex Togo et al. 2019)]GKH46513.1 hypothetical protein CE91St45_10750 [Oscillospiraceae bacterium]
MEDLFLRLVNMSLAASVLGAAVLLLRALLKGRLPRWTFCLLWGLVLVRLLVPFSVPSPVSAFNAIPAARTVETGRRAALRFVEDPGAAVDFPTLQTPRGTGSDAPAEHPVVAPAKVPLTAILSSIWLCGAALLLLYSLFCYLYTMHRLRRARRLPHTPAIDEIFNRVGVRPDRVRLYVSDLFPSPVVCGLVRPRLVLSGLVEEEDVAHVVTHELTHIRRHDNLWKALATLALYLHWFNPFVWLFYRWYVTDMEASCDEAVVRRPETDRKAYAYSLVNMAERSRSAFAGGFLAFGECALKERVKSIMHVRKNTVILTIIAAAVVAGLAVVFLTNPQISPAQAAPSGSAADLPGAEVPEDVAADMKLTYSVLGSLREKDVAEMRVRYGEFGDSPEAEIPPDGYGEVIGGLQELTLGWESTDRESEPVEIVITRKDGKQVAVSLRADSVRLSGTAPKLADKSTVYVYKADVSALRAYALGLLAPAESAPAPARELTQTPAESSAPQVSSPAAPSAQEAASRAADLPPLIEGNPPCLRIPYDEVMEVNLIDRESRTCCPVTGERCGAVLARLNSLTPQEDLSVTPDEAGLRLLQVRLLDGTKYDFWCHSNLLMEGETPLADASRLRDLYDSFYEIEKETYGQNRATAEWLGYMNPYRITGMAVDDLSEGTHGQYRALTSEQQREAIMEVAALLKAVTVKPSSTETLAPGAAHDSTPLFQTVLNFEDGVVEYTVTVYLDGSIEILVSSIPGYHLAYETTGDGTLDALADALTKYAAA